MKKAQRRLTGTIKLGDIDGHTKATRQQKGVCKIGLFKPALTIPSINLEGDAYAPQETALDRIDGMYNTYREIIIDNVEYDIMTERYGRERMDEAVELMLEIAMSNRDYIRIAGDDFPKEVVKSRLLKIGSEHLEYVFDCIDKNTTKVRNIKACGRLGADGDG